MGDMPSGSEQRPPTDYREMRRKHERAGVTAAIGVLVGGGGLLIAVIFGFLEMLAAIPWLILGAAGILGLYLLIVWLEGWANR